MSGSRVLLGLGFVLWLAVACNPGVSAVPEIPGADGQCQDSCSNDDGGPGGPDTHWPDTHWPPPRDGAADESTGGDTGPAPDVPLVDTVQPDDTVAPPDTAPDLAREEVDAPADVPALPDGGADVPALDTVFELGDTEPAEAGPPPDTGGTGDLEPADLPDDETEPVPPLEIRIIAPPAGQVVSGELPVSVVVSGGGPNRMILGVEFHLDNRRFDTDIIPPYASNLDTNAYGDGTHTLMVVTGDTLGRTASAVVAVIFDNTPPQFLWTDPAPDDYRFFEDGPLHLEVGLDDPSMIEVVSFRANGLGVGDLSEPPFEVDVPYADLYITEASLPRNVLVQVRARDRLGQESNASAQIVVHKRYRWTTATLGEIWAPAVATYDGNVLFGNKNSMLYVLSPEGSEVRSRAVGGPVSVGAAVDPASGRIFYGTETGHVVMVTNEFGAGWDVNLGSPPGGQLVYQNDLVYVVTFMGTVYALRASNGGTAWSVPLSCQTTSSPALSAEGTLYVGCQDRRVYAINSGSVQWSYLTGGEVWSSPTVGPGRMVYVGSNDGYLYALRDEGGSATQVWATLIQGQLWGRPLLTSDNAVAVASTSKYVWKVDLRTGERIWRTDVNEGFTYSSPVEGPDGLLYIGSTIGNVVALDLAEGAVRWRFPLATNTIHATPLLFGGNLYVGSIDRSFSSLRVLAPAE